MPVFLLLSWPFCQRASMKHEGQAGGKAVPQLQAEVSSYLQCLGMGKDECRDVLGTASRSASNCFMCINSLFKVNVAVSLVVSKVLLARVGLERV